MLSDMIFFPKKFAGKSHRINIDGIGISHRQIISDGKRDDNLCSQNEAHFGLGTLPII